MSFEAAAKAYKMAKAKEKLVDANTQLANAQAEAGSFYNAAALAFYQRCARGERGALRARHARTAAVRPPS